MPRYCYKMLFILAALLIKAPVLISQANCNDPKLNHPEITDVDISYPSVCAHETTAILSISAIAMGSSFGYIDDWEYSIDGVAWQSNPVFTGVNSGSYQLRARNKNHGSCIKFFSGNPVVVQPIMPYNVVISTTTIDPSSYCTNDGAITVTVSGAAPPFQYRMNAGTWTSSNTFNNLEQGTYNIEVSTHDGACMTSATTTLYAVNPPVISQLAKTNATSCSPPNGKITINALPAWEQFHYSIDNGETWRTTGTFDTLPPGNYPVRVRYAWDELCSIWPSIVTINGPNPIHINSVTTTPATVCSAADGKITINASGSSTLYYRVEGGAWQTSKTITGLAAGSYNVYVRYANSTCVTPFSGNPVIVGPNDLRINSITTSPPTTCQTTTGNGSISIQAENNGLPILYSINGGQSYTSTPTFNGLSAGTYNIVIANANQNCTVTHPLVVLPPPVSLTVQNIHLTPPTNCYAANGGLQIVTSPVGNYQYSLDGGQTFQSAASFSNLTQGIYNIVVKTTDNECSTTYSGNPVQLSALTCPEICNDGIDNDGNGLVDDCPDASCGLTPFSAQVIQPTCPATTPMGSMELNASLPIKNCSNLAPGDIVITSASVFLWGTFKFMPKVHLAGGTQIIFTDKNWTTSGFASGEGLLQWTAPTNGIAAGTEVTVYSAFFSWQTTHGTVLADKNIPGYQNYDSGNPSFRFDGSSGDNVIALCGSSFQNISQITFLFSLNFRTTGPYPAPPGLVAGETSIHSPSQYGATIPAPSIDSVFYSINGGRTWQSSPLFENLAPGLYKALVKRGACVTAYAGNPVRIFACVEICNNGMDDTGNGLADCADPICGVPATTFSITQPGCLPAPIYGEIAITPIAPAGYTYSIDAGANWQGVPVFNNLSPGNYQIAIKRTDTDCLLLPATGAIILQQPTCVEICDDGIDNDGDGLVDCEDPNCGIPADFALDSSSPECPANNNNGILQITPPTSSAVVKDCSTLEPGDIAIIYYNANPDQFAFVPRVALAGGTKIVFTDKGYSNSPPALRSAEGLAQWIAPAAGVPAETEIFITRTPTVSASLGTVFFDTAIPGYAAYDATNPSFNLEIAGDQLIALCGNSLNVNDITFLFAVHANGNTWDNDASSNARSAIPPGLVNGVTALALGNVAEATIPWIPLPLVQPYAYSIDGGATFDTTSLFTGLMPGTYTILIKNQTSGCIAPYSTEPVLLVTPDCPEICDNNIDDDGNGLTDCEDPACGVAPFAWSVNQPSCPASEASGSINFIPSDERSYLYSIDGGISMQSNPVFHQLSAGIYSLVVEAMPSGCRSTLDTIILIAPECPEICGDGIDNSGNGLIDCEDTDCGVAVYEVNVAQPNHLVTPLVGQITIDIGLGNYEYSVDNGAAWRNTTTFDSLALGKYYVLVRNTESSCIRFYRNNPVEIAKPIFYELCGDGKDNDGDGDIDCDDSDCAVAPYTVEVTQPALLKGTIKIKPSDTKIYNYSIDSNTSRSVSPIFRELEPAAYNVVVSGNGCIKEYENNPVILEKDENTPECQKCQTIGREVQGADCVIWIPSTDLSDEFSMIPEACPPVTTEYRMIVTDGNGNKLADERYLVEVQTISLSIYPDDPSICTEGSVVLEAITWENNPNYIYNWSTGDTGALLEVTQPRTYSVTIADEVTGCQQEASVEITESTLDVQIVASQNHLCPGDQVQLEAVVINDAGEYTYEWSTGETASTITIEQADTYTVTVTNIKTGCVAIEEHSIAPIDIEVEIIADLPLICPPTPVELSVEEDATFVNYAWSNGTSGTTAFSISVTTPGDYSVTITDENGCTASDEITVDDANDPDAIQTFFEELGFYRTPITIVDPGITAPKPSEQKSLNSACDFSDCDDGSCLINDNGVPAFYFGNNSGSPVTNLESILAQSLAGFQQDFGYPAANAFITSNDDICNCPDYLKQIKGLFQNAGLGYWIHIYQDENGEDQLYILSNEFTNDNEHRTFVEQLLDLANQINLSGDETAKLLLDLLLGNFVGGLTNDNEVGSPCYKYQKKDAIIIAPSGILMQLPQQAVLRFSPFPKDEKNFPVGALTGFTGFFSDGSSGYYFGRTNANGDFIGYISSLIIGGTNDNAPYASPAIQQIPPIVTLGTYIEEDSGAIIYGGALYSYTCNDILDVQTTGAGATLDALDGTCFEKIGGSEGNYDVSLPAITAENIASSASDVICDWNEGVLVRYTNDTGVEESFYVAFNETSSDPDDLIYRRWNCAVGLWEIYTPTADNQNLISQLKLEHYLCQNAIVIGSGGTSNEQNLTTPGCYQLSADQIEPFEFTWMPDPDNSEIIDYVGMDTNTISLIQGALDRSSSVWGMDVKYILSGEVDSPGPGGGDVPLEPPTPSSAALALARFNSFVLSPNSETDLLFWIHYKKDGTASFCLRFADDFFESNEANISPEEQAETREVVLEAILEAPNVRVETHLDNAPFVDPDDTNSYPANANNPWYMGIRVGQESNVNFYKIVTAEVPGIIYSTAKEFQVPERLWKKDGNSIFDAPGGLAGVGDGIIEETTSLAQTASLAVSVIKDKETRNAIIESILHIDKVAIGILKEKFDNYTNPDVEVRWHEGGKDAVSIIFILVTGGASKATVAAKDVLKKLSKDALDIVESLRQKIGNFPQSVQDDFFKKFDGVSNAVQQDFLEFLGKVGEVHYAKLVENPILVDVWKQFGDELDLTNIFKKFPEGGDFYAKLEEVFGNGNGGFTDPNKLKKFLGDISAPGNEGLLDLFKRNPDAIKTWETLNGRLGNGSKKVIAPEILKAATKHLEDEDFLRKIGGGDVEAGRAAYLDMVSNYAGKCSTCGGAGLGALPDAEKYLEIIYDFGNKFGDRNITGYDKILQDLRSGGAFTQDGLQHALKQINGLNPEDIKSFDFNFQGSNVECVKCRFDVKMKDGVTPKFYEFKSFKPGSIAGLSINQFTEYLRGINFLDELKYMFNKDKISDISIIKGEFRKLFSSKSEEIFNSNPTLFQQYFPDVSSFKAFMSNPNADLNHPIFNFITVG